MPKAHNPRKGSMQYWPRKRAKKEIPRVRSWKTLSTVAQGDMHLLGFAGYKVGMTHLHYIDNNKNSPTKGQEVFQPVTVVECPPLQIAALRFYKETEQGLRVATEIFVPSLPKDLKKKLSLPKAVDFEGALEKLSFDQFADVRALVFTQPKLTGIGKKKPELFEVAVSKGSVEEKIAYLKGLIGKPIGVDQFFTPGMQVDVHAVTKGKGFQGPVKRFGVSIRHHKSEKTKRGPGSLGPWVGQAHILYRVAHAGQMGYHLRTDYNKQILVVGTNPDEINPASGFQRYGLVKNPYLLVAGSVPGPKKRLLLFTPALYPNRKLPQEVPEIVAVRK